MTYSPSVGSFLRNHLDLYGRLDFHRKVPAALEIEGTNLNFGNLCRHDASRTAYDLGSLIAR